MNNTSPQSVPQRTVNAAELECAKLVRERTHAAFVAADNEFRRLLQLSNAASSSGTKSTAQWTSAEQHAYCAKYGAKAFRELG